jgi:L-ascorbate metabolism protein UlaG (beta-lactamase superfamily)
MAISYGSLTIEVLGHASLRIETADGTVCYVDPWSDVLGDHVGDADLVFVTHDDYDHYDPDAIGMLATEATTVVVYEGVDTRDLAHPVTTLATDGELTVDGVSVAAVPAYNAPDGEHVRDDGTPFHQQGEVVGLLLEFDGTTVYFASDTDFLPAHEAIEADVFVPPIGGTYTMDREEAAAAVRAIDPGLVVPVHYGTFEAIETDVDAFVADLEADGFRVELG